MNVKAQGLLNAAAWVREKFGDESLERVLGQCQPSVRERVGTAIAINWHPQEELADFLTAVESVLGKNDGKLAETIGAHSAKLNLRHLGLRLAFFLARPEFLMRRVASVWRQYNEGGEMKVLEFVAGHMLAELVGMPRPNWAICCSVTGWLHEAGIATGMRQLTTHHLECKTRGGARCVWDLTWHGGRASP